MHFLQTSALLTFLICTLLGLVTGQTIDPSTVDADTRSKWCLDQRSSCPILCDQNNGNNGKRPTENRCDPDTLAFSCVCSGGVIPNASEYSQTIPFYECQKTQDNCVANCNGQTACQSSCRDDHPCGAQNPTRVNTSTISSTMSASGTATGNNAASTTGEGDFSGFGGTSTATGTSDAVRQAQAFAFGYGRVCGLATVLFGIFVGFTIML